MSGGLCRRPRRNEWLAGTNPTNGTSCLKFDTLVKESQGLGLGFDTVSGLLYNVYWRSNLVGGTDWALFNSFISTGGTAHVAFTNQIPHGFFQLRVNP